MDAMREYSAREWLLRYVSMRHDTHKIDEIVSIAQNAGYLSYDCKPTKIGRQFIKSSQEIDREVRHGKQIIFPL